MWYSRTQNKLNYVLTFILSLVGVTYKTGFGLIDWIYCTLYIHTTRDYTYVIQRYR
jgi:uncharacterized membrane protein YqaE (UPF0057 family)